MPETSQSQVNPTFHSGSAAKVATEAPVRAAVTRTGGFDDKAGVNMADQAAGVAPTGDRCSMTSAALVTRVACQSLMI